MAGRFLSASPARLLPLGAFLLAALAGCQDYETPTALGPAGPVLSQSASTPIVNVLSDDGDGTCTTEYCTLRDAIAFADPGATITFSVTGTITLDQTKYELLIRKSLTIQGPGAGVLEVSGNDQIRVFTISDYGATSPNVLIRRLTIRNGRHSDNGGAVYAYIAALTLDSVVVRNSVVTGGSFTYGGGISASRTTLHILNSTITGNSVTGTYVGAGGGITNGYGSLVLVNSTVSGNQASIGGGIYSDWTGNTVTLINSTVSGNSATFDGGGIAGNVGSMTFQYSTVSANTANMGGGVMSQASLTLTGAVVAGNSATTSPDLYDPSTLATASFSLIGSADGHGIANGADGNIVGSDPLLGSLADNGGFTQTHGLATGSPAIDQIPEGTIGCGSSFATDQRGLLRPQGTGCDIGAYEREPTTGKTAGSVTINNIPTDATYGGSFTPTYTKLGDGTASTASSTPTICSVSAGEVSFDAAGTCTLVASVTEGTDHEAATGDPQSFTIAKAAGSVTINNLPASGVVDGSFTPTYAKAGDGTPSTASSTPGICEVEAGTGGLVRFKAEGTCTLTASISEGTNHQPATGSPQSFGVAPETPTIGELMADVEALGPDGAGALNKGQTNSLLKTLETVNKKLEKNQLQAAIENLELFIVEVQTFITDGVLTSAQGQPLIDGANLIIESLQ